MSSNATARPLILIVEDEPDVAEAHALKLGQEFETRIADGGTAALEEIDDDVDAVLLDRRMPGLHGDDVLAEIRERGYDCPVIMTTAVSPDLNILEMDFDDYLCKPIMGDTLVDTLEQHVSPRSDGNPRLEEFFEVIAKVEVLESERSQTELEANEEYQQLKRRADELGSELSASMDDFDEVVSTYKQIERNSL